MTVRIVTDSSCDLPQNLADALGISIVPLSIRFGAEEFIDRTTITTDEFWTKIAASPDLPETAAPSPGQFATVFQTLKAEGATAIVVVALSSSLSATMQSAEIGARDLASDIDIRIVDSRNATIGLGLLALECAELAQKGASADEVVALANSIIPRIRVIGALDTIDNLKKGGRISGAKAFMASALSIKPLIQVADGLIAEYGKQRTRSKALAFLVQNVRENASNIERFGLMHAQCADIDSVIAMIKEVYPKEFSVSDIGAIIGSHTGVGTVGLAYILSE